jgi:hypothetical protein
MRSLKLTQVMEMHEDARPVWRIVQATGTPEGEVRRIIRTYQDALDPHYGLSHCEVRARAAVVEAYVAALGDHHRPEWLAGRLGITVNMAQKCLARIERRRRSGGAAALKLGTRHVHG